MDFFSGYSRNSDLLRLRLIAFNHLVYFIAHVSDLLQPFLDIIIVAFKKIVL